MESYEENNNYLQGLLLMILIEIFTKFRFEWGERSRIFELIY